jgi:hypothetical protein
MTIPYYYSAIPPFFEVREMYVCRYNGVASDMDDLKEKIYCHYISTYLDIFYYLGLPKDTTYDQIVKSYKNSGQYYIEDEFLKYYAFIDGKWEESPVGDAEDFHDKFMEKDYDKY